MKHCNNCELRTSPGCDLAIPCCKCDDESCNSRQPCPRKEENSTVSSDIIKEDVPLTMEEKEILAEKTGYSIQSIDRVLRGYSPVLPRHQKMVELYKKIVYLKKLHHEDYITDIKNL